MDERLFEGIESLFKYQENNNDYFSNTIFSVLFFFFLCNNKIKVIISSYTIVTLKVYEKTLN
jgi:hypothetical protein